jgi:superfamily II DNA or RNA helicase
MFECTICYTECKETSRLKKIECNNCNYIVCSACQKNYGKLECSSCHVLFDKKFGYEKLGKTFVNNNIKQNELKEIMIQQRKELETIAPLVEWTKICNLIKANANKAGVHVVYYNNQGIVVNRGLPTKPSRSIPIHKTINCPLKTCVGVVIRGECNFCHASVCNDCECIMEGKHKCDPNILKNVQEIKESTKHCPRCNTLIHKTEGCDHMQCTYCGTHFSYQYLTILLDSSNHHYRNRLIRQNLTPVNNDCATSAEHPRIPLDIINQSIKKYKREVDQEVVEVLYDTTTKIRYLMSTEYNLNWITSKSRDKYDELQVKYAMNEINDKQWESLVYKNFIKQRVYELINNTLNLYLVYTDDFQGQLFDMIRESKDFDHDLQELKLKCKNFIDLLNDSNKNLFEDHHMNTILYIRNFGDNPETATKISLLPEKKMEKVELVMKSIRLYPYQEQHVSALNNILDNSYFAFDLSSLGTGKTYTSAKIFQERGFKHIVTISPLSVKNKWLYMNQEFGLNSDQHLTYNEIAGSKFNSPKCGYLIRDDFKVYVAMEGGGTRLIDKYSYKATDKYKQLVKEGLLIVIDEFQNIKNNSAQTDACAECIRIIHDDFINGGHSRVLLLSGSPVDKKEQIIRLMKTVHVMKDEKLVNGKLYAGINEIVDYIKKNIVDGYDHYVKGTMNNYIRITWESGGHKYEQNAWSATNYVYSLFLNVFKPYLSSIMIIPENSDVKLHKYNGLFLMNNEEHHLEITQALQELSRITNFNGTTVRIVNARDTLIQITRTLMRIEYSKINIFTRLVKQALEKNANQKIVIGLNYNDSIQKLVDDLKDYNIAVIVGSTTLKNRRKIIDKFQEPNCELQIIIANINVISTGIDLDDKHGNYPRVCYASPNYNTINIYQLGHRFLRGLDTKSDTNIYMVYTQNHFERKIMEALMAKGLIMKTISDSISATSNTYPCDYMIFRE